jgi:hypothetical protein
MPLMKRSHCGDEANRKAEFLLRIHPTVYLVNVFEYSE